MSSRSRSSGCGIVKGWWAAWGLPSSSVPSKSGNSVTHKNRRSPSPTGGRPRSRRSWPEHLARRAPLVGDDEHEVAGRRAGGRHEPGPLGVGEELVERRRQRQPAPSDVTLNQARPLAPSSLARSTRASSRLRPSDAPSGTRIAFTHGAAKARTCGAGEHRAQVDELHPEAQVGLVDAEAVHGLVPGHASRWPTASRPRPPRWRRRRPR